MNCESGQLIDNNLEILQDNACGPAMIRTMINAGLQLQGKDMVTAPSQKEIGQQVYSWHYFVVYRHPFKLKLRDNWCLPEKVCQYLSGWFTDVSFHEGVAVNSLQEWLDQGKAVGILLQDVSPDKRHPGGYPDNLDNGHWTLVKAINLEEGWIELADSYRDKDGNERWFDDKGIVLADGQVKDRKNLKLEHRRIYRMKIADFTKHWWDYKFNQTEKYVHPAVAVDLNSFKA